MRECLFCDRPAKTLEHAWPDWILTKLRPPFIEGIIGSKKLKRLDKNPEVKIRCVCKKCNEGWMSRLEDANKPLIGSLMQDIAMPLDPLQQFTVALWATKMAIVWDAISHSFRPTRYTREDRHALRSISTIPPITTIWLGRYGGKGVLGAFSHEIEYGAVERDLITHGNASTFVVGRLALQVYTLHAPPEHGVAIFNIEHKFAPWNRLLVKIHPFERHAHWPPPDSINDIQTLAKKWSLGEERPFSGRK